MIYVQNTHFPEKQKVYAALQKIFGIGHFYSFQICDQLGCSKFTTVAELSQSQVDKLVRILNQYYVTGSDLKRLINDDTKRLAKIGCFRGIHHQMSNVKPKSIKK